MILYYIVLCHVIVGVPWRDSISARLAWGDIVSYNMLSKELAAQPMLSTLRRRGTPMRARLQLHDPRATQWPRNG